MASPRDWPGIHLAKNIVDGEPLRGYWIDRTKLRVARAAAKREGKGRKVKPMDHATWYDVEIEPLPNWRDCPHEEYQSHVTEIVRQIEEKTLARHLDAATRTEDDKPFAISDYVLGPANVRAADPQFRPAYLKQSPAPLFHTASEEMFKALRKAYSDFVGDYRSAARKLKKGDLTAVFPQGCFPPGLPFVPG